jgi:pyrroloquinoline-quinone synthase
MAFSAMRRRMRAVRTNADHEEREMSQALAPEAFIQDLVARIQAKRTFGGHPVWLALADGKLSGEQLKLFAVQFFLQVREFPRAVSAMHSNCPFPKERMELAESVYEEETGRISGCNLPHPELFIRFGEAVGLKREDMVDGRPLPATRALIDWFELSTKQRSFIEAAAAINLAAEGQVPGAFGPMARRLQQHYGLSRDAVAFWDIHEMADAEHSEVGDNIVVRHATDAATQARVRDALQHSLDAWWQFFDGIQAAL